MKEKYKKIILIAIPVLFYAFFSLWDGPIDCVDTPGYLAMSVIREPIYPLYLGFFRLLLGDTELYLYVAVFFQGLLMALSIISFVNYFGNKLKLNFIQKICIECIFLGVSLLCRFFANRHSMYSNSLLSESLAIPLYIIFFRYLLEYVFDKNNKSLIIATILSFILISTRKQMYSSLFLLVIAVLTNSKKIKENIIKLVVVVLTVVGLNKTLDFCYTKIVNDIDSTHTSSTRFLTTMVFYCSEKSDSKYIENEDVRLAFIDVYEKCEKQNLLKPSNSKSWYDRANKFANSYDLIQLNTMWPTIMEHVQRKNSGTNNELEIIVDKYNDEISFSILPHILPSIIETFFDSMIFGLMTTVSSSNYKLIYYSLFVFLLYIILLVSLIIKKKNDNYIKFGVYILLSILINNSIVSALIFAQSRYTIYNMPLFYIFIFVCGSNYLVEKKNHI